MSEGRSSFPGPQSLTATSPGAAGRAGEVTNPFPGPQPYRAADRRHFFGRDALVKKVTQQILARPATTLFGPSGAGKSSLMQAGVIPGLLESHEFRVVRVDGWPPGEEPLWWLVCAIFDDLELGAPPAGKSELDALDDAMMLAERRSEQPILIYLDQIEQLLIPERAEAEAEALLDGVARLARAPVQGLQMVLSLREDYLGRFRDRARDRSDLLAHGFRLGLLTVGEMVKAVCQAAAVGAPPQRWDEAQLRGLMCEVRTPGQRASDEAEVQAAYAQIVCRALFQERAKGRAESEIEAEPILRRYLETTLDDLGPLGLDARRLLEDHLVTEDGSRTLRTENELLRVLPERKLAPILKVLEDAAILHAEAHQGSRYFEIGHDWLARKVHEERQQREREKERQRLVEEQEAALQRQRDEANARLARVRAQRRFFAIVALVSIAVAAAALVTVLYALRQRTNAIAQRQNARAAEEKAKASEEKEKKKAIEASDARLLAGFRELKNAGQLAWATKLLFEVQQPEDARGWVALASEALRTTTLELTLRGHDEAAAWSPDGKRVLTASDDGTARLWNADGKGDPVPLVGHKGSVTAAAWSPDGKRVLTASEDKTARVWSADDKGDPVVLAGHKGPITAAAWSPDGARVLTASEDKTARVWNADGKGDPVVLGGHDGAVTSAAWSLHGDRVITASEDGTARLWSADGTGKVRDFKGHTKGVLFVAVSPDGKRLVTTSSDETARIWDMSGKGKPIVLRHDGIVVHAAWSPDGARVATASADRIARVWSADGKGKPVVLEGHTRAVMSVAFRSDGRYIATASRDQTAHVWPAEGGTPLVLRGHESPVLAAVWSPDGARVLTVAAGGDDRSRDHASRIWRPGHLESLPRERRGICHSAFIGLGGDRIVSACDDSAVRLWRADGAGDPEVFKGHAAWVASAALSPDGARIVTASFDATARVVRVDRGGAPVVLEGHKAAVRAAAFSPDGAHVVTASDDRTARVWRADGQGKSIVLSGHGDALTSAAWSPDGQRVVTCSLDRTARVQRADGTGAAVLLEGHRGDVRAAAWSPDGQRIVTASEDGTAQVWSADTGAPRVMLDHGSPVLRAIWSPDGTRIAAASLNGELRLWSADGRGEPVVLDVTAPILAMAFIEGGKRIVAILADNTTRTWTIDVEKLKADLVAANADCLPQGMRAIYLGETADKLPDGYAACELEHGRTTFLTEDKEP